VLGNRWKIVQLSWFQLYQFLSMYFSIMNVRGFPTLRSRYFRSLSEHSVCLEMPGNGSWVRCWLNNTLSTYIPCIYIIYYTCELNTQEEMKLQAIQGCVVVSGVGIDLRAN